ncbi:hypothetical protein NE646_14490, partial [Bittarella massiliensis]|nr:hypothetical protein [Bittarella massiliensis (ex Durand et al. 2017)]
IMLVGGVGTLLFFMSLSGFLLRICKSNKRLYYNNLNMFVLRQLNSKINTTYLSVTFICLMLLRAVVEADVVDGDLGQLVLHGLGHPDAEGEGPHRQQEHQA